MFKMFAKMFSKNKNKKESETMADEKEVKEVETEEKVETKEEPKVDEKATEKVEDKEEKVEKKEEKPEEKPEEPETTEEKPTAEVQDTESEGNGVRIEDLVTKEYLAEKLSALEAKYDAVVKENADLKDELSGMKDKYENSDFGGFQRKGLGEKSADVEDSFDAYSKAFM